MPFSFSAVVKLERRRKIPVIRHRHGRHLLLDYSPSTAKFRKPIEQRVIGVAM